MEAERTRFAALYLCVVANTQVTSPRMRGATCLLGFRVYILEALTICLPIPCRCRWSRIAGRSQRSSYSSVSPTTFRLSFNRCDFIAGRRCKFGFVSGGSRSTGHGGQCSSLTEIRTARLPQCHITSITHSLSVLPLQHIDILDGSHNSSGMI